MSSRMPTYFIPHGAGPCFFMQATPATMWDPMAAFLRSIAQELPQPPRAILVVSAHWLTEGCRLTSADEPELYYDYYGFPQHTYELKYPVLGDPKLAARVVELLQQAGISANEDTHRGLDHGVFIPLLLTYPDANIPVVQLSLDKSLDAQWHLKIGAALESLRDEGVLIIGSGMSFHNMRAYGNTAFTHISRVFDDWLTQAVMSEPLLRNKALANWQAAPGAVESHPLHQEEHLLPLMVVAGAAHSGVGRKVFTDTVLSVAISGFRFD